jgi:hypothetical protein
VGDVADADAADLVVAELHGGVAVEQRLVSDPRRSLVGPRLDQLLEDGDRGTPDAVVALDGDVVLLLLGAALDPGDGDQAGDAAQEVLEVELVGLLLDGHSGLARS